MTARRRGGRRDLRRSGGDEGGKVGWVGGWGGAGKKKGEKKRTPSASVHVCVSVPRLAEGDIPPGTRPDFIPSDHVHPLFISPTHSPRCHNMIHSCPPLRLPLPSPTLPPPSKPRQSLQPPPPLHLSLWSTIVDPDGWGSLSKVSTIIKLSLTK